MERKELIEQNAKIFQKLGKELNEHASKNCKSLVIANPANTNCLILSHYASSIDKKNFTCLTRLDQNRAVFQITEQFKRLIENFEQSNISGVIIWGNHSSTQFPDINYAKYDGKLLKEYFKDKLKFECFKQDLTEKVQKRGADIIEFRGLSSGFSAAIAIKDHFRDWYFGTGSKYTSMGIISDGSYNVDKGLCFSYPVLCTGNFQYEIKQNLEFDDIGLEKMRLTMKELNEEKSEVVLEWIPIIQINKEYNWYNDY